MPNSIFTSTFDPTDYGQENYREGLRGWYDTSVQDLYSHVPEGARDKARNPLDVNFEKYSQGYKDYEVEQSLLPEEYDPSIESAENLTWSEDLLKQMAEGAGSVAEKFRTRATTDVNKAFGRRRGEFDESLAQTGLGRSGIGSAVKSELAGEQAEAIAGVDLTAEQIETDVNFQVISQLLGIDQMRLGAGQFDTSIEQRESQFSKGMIQDWMKFNEQMEFQQDQFKWQKEQAEFDFWRDLATPLLTGGVSNFAYGLGRKA